MTISETDIKKITDILNEEVQLNKRLKDIKNIKAFYQDELSELSSTMHQTRDGTIMFVSQMKEDHLIATVRMYIMGGSDIRQVPSNYFMENKKLRWFLIFDNYMLQVVAAYSHSRAKLSLNRAFGNSEDWEALRDWRSELVKVELDINPEKEGDIYYDSYELLKKGVWSNAWTEEPCLTCQHNCGEGNPQYYNHETKKFYCKYCDMKDCNCSYHSKL